MGRELEFNVRFLCMHNNRTEDPLQVTTTDRTTVNIYYSEKGILNHAILLYQYNIGLNDTKS